MGVIGVPKQLSSKEELYQRGEFAGRQFSFVEDSPAGEIRISPPPGEKSSSKTIVNSNKN